MKVEKGKVKPWREKHNNTFEEEKEIIWVKTTRREKDLLRFANREIFLECWDKYLETKRKYLEVSANGGKWGERKIILDEIAELIDGDDRKAFMMLDFYRMECSTFNAEKMIRKYGGSFGWSHYEWMTHWYKQLEGQEYGSLARWTRKKRFGFLVVGF